MTANEKGEYQRDTEFIRLLDKATVDYLIAKWHEIETYEAQKNHHYEKKPCVMCNLRAQCMEGNPRYFDNFRLCFLAFQDSKPKP